MNNDKDKMQRSIDEFTEWQDNQYNPGYWIGGIVPNNLLSPRKPKIVGVGLIVVALNLLGWAIVFLVNYVGDASPRSLIDQIGSVGEIVFLVGFGLLLLVGGIRKTMKKSKPLNK